ncbi:MAG: aminotransferase class I/II-fold pyridoxal phosphate-dependent enzyme [Gammaproteobacteria bacterium]
MSGHLELPDFALETYFSKWEFKARHHLTASDAESMSVSELLDLGTEDDRKAYENLHLGYIPTWGTEKLRCAVASTYTHLSEDNILAFAGAGEALFWAMQLFISPGDHVIVNVPNYQSVESVPIATGVQVEGLPLWSDDSLSNPWTLDLDKFKSLLRPNTKLVSVNFPNNPTGFVPDPQTWQEFNTLCHERGIVLISDEVYRGVELDPSRTLPAAASINPTALTVSVTSKAYGLPGLRVGWVASQSKEMLQRLERAKHYTSICNAGPSEQLAAVALRNEGKIFARNRKIIQRNDAALKEFISNYPDFLDYATPDGGCVAFPRWLGTGTASDFCTRAVEEDGVLLLPASVYRSDLADVPTDRLRIGIGRRNVPESLNALAEHLSKNY